MYEHVGAGLGTIVGAGLGTIVGAGLGTIVGAGLGNKVSYLPIMEQQNPPYLTDNGTTKPALAGYH
ncbi:MAG: glycine zipper family protein [Coleofasciculus sp. C2-GNP5-27]